MCVIKPHKEEREYTLPDGLMSEKAISDCETYVWNLQMYGVPSTITEKLPTLEEFTEKVKNTKPRPRRTGDAICIEDCLPQYNYTRILMSCLLAPDSICHVGSTTAHEKNLKTWIRRWHRRLMEHWPMLSSKHGPKLVKFEKLGTQWTVKGNGEYVGAFPKRAAKFLFKEYGISLRPEHVETLGNIASTDVSTNSIHKLAWDRDFMINDADAYCHPDSCWWGSYAGGREMLYENGGWAIREFKDGRPISRCWIAPHNLSYTDKVTNKKTTSKIWFIFNAYGKLDLNKFARLISMESGWSYRKCFLNHDGENLYINGGTGIILAPSDVLVNLEESPHIDLEWEDIYGSSCCICGDGLGTDNTYTHPDTGDMFCETCFYVRYDYCYRCGGLADNEDLQEYRHGRWCPECLDSAGVSRCESCDELGDSFVECTGGPEFICTDCARDFVECAECNKYSEETTKVDTGEMICEKCIQDYAQCAWCEDYCEVDSMNEASGNVMICGGCTMVAVACDKCGLCEDKEVISDGLCETCVETTPVTL